MSKIYRYQGKDYTEEDAQYMGLLDETICNIVGDRCNNGDPHDMPEYLSEWEEVEIIYKEQ